MGIENDRDLPAATADEYHSLPLMGIENVSVDAKSGSNTMVSLPLMGIENTTAMVGHALGRQHLITPHGDRKH